MLDQNHGGLMVQPQLMVLIRFFGYHQLISQPTNLLVDSSVHPTWYENCHRQKTYCKLNFRFNTLIHMRVYLNFWKSWCKCSNQADWMFFFLQKYSPRVNIFNKTSVNIFSNFIQIRLLILMINYLRTHFFEWAKTLKTKFPKNTILEIIFLIFLNNQ